MDTVTIATPGGTPMTITRADAIALFNQLLALLWPPPPKP